MSAEKISEIHINKRNMIRNLTIDLWGKILLVDIGFLHDIMV